MAYLIKFVAHFIENDDSLWRLETREYDLVGCKDPEGNVIIPAKYDGINIHDERNYWEQDFRRNFIFAWHTMETDYGMMGDEFDLYSRFGDLLFGNIRRFEEVGQYYLFEVGGHYNSYPEEDSGRHKVKLENSYWLVLNKDLRSVMRGSDGKHVQFQKGFVVDYNYHYESRECIFEFNFDAAVLVDSEPTFSGDYMLAEKDEQQCIVRLSTGSIFILPYAVESDSFGHCYGDLFYEWYERRIHERNWDTVPFMRLFSLYETDFDLYKRAGFNFGSDVKENTLCKHYFGEEEPLYFSFTKPVGDLMFGFRWISLDNYRLCAVDLIRDHRTETVIASISYEKLEEYVRKSFFRIIPVRINGGTTDYSFLRPDIFDEPYRDKFKILIKERVVHFKEYFYNKRDQYWFPDERFLTKDEVKHRNGEW